MTDPVHNTTLVCSYSSARRARIVAESVRQELGEIDGSRSVTRLDRRGSTIELAIEATDLTALRAAVNTWLTLIDVAERTESTAESAVTP